MKKAILLIAALVLGTFAFSQPLTQVGSWEYGPTEAVAIKDSTAYISSGSYLWVLDISNESNISLVDEIKLENYINYIRRIGNYLYVSKEDTILNIYDIHTANSPSLVNQIIANDGYSWNDVFEGQDTIWLCRYRNYEYLINDTISPILNRYIGYGTNLDKSDSIIVGLIDENYSVYNGKVSGNTGTPSDVIPLPENLRGNVIQYPYGYFGYGSRGIGIMDISNIYSIDLHSTINTNGYTYDIELIEDTIMIATRGLNGIGVYDVENDTTFTLIGECDTYGYTYEIEVIGNRLYVGARSGGLIIIDITDKSNPTVLGEYQGYGECRRMDIEGDRLYSASGDGGLMIMDITNRTNPTVIGQCYTKDIAEDVVKEGSYVYVADGDSGLTVIDITDENNPSVVGGCEVGGYGRYANIYGDICAIGGSEDLNEGLGIIDVSTPNNPIFAYEIMNDYKGVGFTIIDSILHCHSTPGGHPRYEVWDISNAYSPAIQDTYIENLGYNYSIAANSDISVLNYHDSLFYFDLTDITNINKSKAMQSPFTVSMEIFNNYLYILTQQPWLYIYDIASFPTVDTIQIIPLEMDSRNVYALSDYVYLTHDKYGISIWGDNTGIEDKNNQINTDISIISTLNAIQIQNNTNTTQTYQITDITGRVIDNIITKQGLNTYTPQQSGIYFVINMNKNIVGKAIIVR